MSERRRAAIVGAAVVLVATAIAVGLAVTQPAGDQAAGSSDDATPASAGTTDTAAALPQAAAAASAAAGFVRSTGRFASAGPLTRRDLILAMTTPDYGAKLVEVVERDLQGFEATLGVAGLTSSDVMWAEYPLTATASLDDGRADVQVWSVLILGLQGGPSARQLWRTSRISLALTDGSWKVNGWSATPGPTPALTAQADISALDRIGEVVAWPVVGQR